MEDQLHPPHSLKVWVSLFISPPLLGSRGAQSRLSSCVTDSWGSTWKLLTTEEETGKRSRFTGQTFRTVAEGPSPSVATAERRLLGSAVLHFD